MSAPGPLIDMGDGATHALTSEGHDASEDGTGRGAPIVATGVSLRGREGGSTIEESGPVSPALRGSSGGGSRQHVAAFDRRNDGAATEGASPTLNAAHDTAPLVAPTLRGSVGNGGGGQKDDAMLTQGFDLLSNGPPSDELAPAVRGQGGNTMPHVMLDPATGQEVPEGATCTFDPPPDGRRYAACGDGVASPQATWIGLRLHAVLLGMDPDDPAAIPRLG